VLAGFGFATSFRAVQLHGARFPAVKPSSLVFLVGCCCFVTVASDSSSPVLFLSRRIRAQVFRFFITLSWGVLGHVHQVFGKMCVRH
jgi:hypothetical protein